MRFQVPQFIEVEDKIFGPLTLKQFIYLAGGAGLCIVIYLFLPLVLAIIPIVAVIAFVCALAFFKVNNKPFVSFLESAFEYGLHPKLYIWQHEVKEVVPEEKNAKKKADENSDSLAPFIPKLSDSKLKDLTWSLDAKSSLNPAPAEAPKK